MWTNTPTRNGDAPPKGACYALISRVRLLAASPLFNDRQNPSGSACGGECSAEKWKTAAEAAKYFLENTRGYALHRSTDPERYGDYEDLFLRRYSPPKSFWPTSRTSSPSGSNATASPASCSTTRSAC